MSSCKKFGSGVNLYVWRPNSFSAYSEIWRQYGCNCKEQDYYHIPNALVGILDSLCENMDHADLLEIINDL